MIKLLTPANKENVILLRDRHREYIANPISDPAALKKVDWLNLKVSGLDYSYPNPVLFTFKKERCSLVDAVKKGDRVKVQFTIDGRRWDGPNGTRYFTDLTGWKIEVLNADGTATEPVPVPQPAEAPADIDAGDPDDLPF